MNDFYTTIVVKNIPAVVVEQILKKVICSQNLLTETEQVVLKLKNSRVLVLNFSNGISKVGFNEILKALVLQQDNIISKPEFVAIYCGEIIYPIAKSNLFNSPDAVIMHYKLDKGPLHEIITLNLLNCQPKKWWQFWK